MVMTMNKRLKKIRITLGLTQSELAEKLSMSRITIAQMETGARNVTERTIKDICREFKVNYSWLTQGKGDMFVDDETDVITLTGDITISDDIRELKKLLNNFQKTAKAIMETSYIDNVSNLKIPHDVSLKNTGFLNNRLKILRTTLNLTQTELAERLGLTRITIARMEAGARNVTDRTIKDICREFKVNYMWLTMDEGNMFIDSETDILAAIDNILAGEDEFYKNIVKMVVNLDPNEIKLLKKMAQSMLNEQKID